MGCLLLLLLSISQVALSQAWKTGRSSLLRNDFKTARTQLTAAIRNSRPGQELAETYKFLGVAQYMAGDRKGAQESFGLAKANNPAVRLSAAEVIDESVIPVFNQTKALRRQTPRVGSSAQTRTQGSSRGALSSVPRQPSVNRKKAKRTLLKVVSNAPSAAISIDGINYGTAGQEIEVQPGTVILEVASNGFRTKAIKVQLQPMTSSVVTVNLDKIIIKPKPQPVARTMPMPQTKIPLPNQAQNTGTKTPQPGKNDLFGDDPMTTQTYTTPPRQQTQTPYVTPPPPPAQPVMPQQGYAQPPGGYSMPPQYAPMPGQQMSPYPVYPQYPPMQPYGAPMYQAPPYGGYMAPPNPYAYPPPPAYAPAPMVDPYGGYLGPPPEAPNESSAAPISDGPQSTNGGMPPPPILPPESVEKPSLVKTSQDKCGAIRLLPFGAGQFCNGSTLKGAVFLGAEAASLFFYQANSKAAASHKKKLETYLAAQEAKKADITEETELLEHDKDTERTKKSGEDAISKANQNAQYSMVSFIGLWGIGVADAYINKPSPKSKKKSRKPRIIYSYDLDLDTAPLGTWSYRISPDEQSPEIVSNFDVKIGYTPIAVKDSTNLIHGVTIGLKFDL